MKKKVVAFVFFAVFVAAGAFAQQKFVIATPGFDHPIALVSQKVLPEAYKQLGYDVQFQVLPPQRSLAMFDNGTVDGYIFADASFLKSHPNAVEVKTPIGSDDIVVFTKDKDFRVNGWQSLRPYTIGYQVGMLVVQNNVENLKGDPAQTPMDAFHKMIAGRDDIVVMPKGVGLMMIKAGDLQGIKVLSPPLEKVPLYHFVTKKWAGLAGKLSAILSEMRNSGYLKSVTDKIEAQFMK